MEITSDSLESVILIIADISGYMRYMTANAKTLAHSQVIITELIKSIIGQMELPLEVAKLEGDAVFMFGRKQSGSKSWSDFKPITGSKLITFFKSFADKLDELRRSTTCTCQACSHINTLRLKLVVHSGDALFHRIFNFVELAGVDVIIVHRLLKNSIASDEYLLMTEAARLDLEFPDSIHLIQSSESYDNIGRVNTLIYKPNEATDASVKKGSVDARSPDGFSLRFRRSWNLFYKFWIASLMPRSYPKTFHHLTSNSGVLGKYSFAVLTLFLSPIFLPVGTVSVALHSLKK
ncbi:MAG: DUF2652 domain-containing protein [Pedosphaera sp.]|nr:DUF2652 domain-containing protein [Pedosphaera sp.]